MAPPIIAEQRDSFFLTSLIAGIICAYQLDHSRGFGKASPHITSTVFCATFTIVIIHVWLWVRARPREFLGVVIF